jgi:hypothetical protein
MILALVLPFAFLGIAMIRVAPRIRAIVSVPVILGAALSVVTWRQVAADATSHIDHTHRETARWIGAHVHPGESVAAFDIGAIGFELADRQVIDLGGLLDPEYMPYLREGRACTYLAARRARVIVLPQRPADLQKQLADVGALIGAFCPGQSPQRVAHFSTDRAVWENAWYHTTNAFPELGVYIVEAAGDLRRGSQD